MLKDILSTFATIVAVGSGVIVGQMMDKGIPVWASVLIILIIFLCAGAIRYIANIKF